MILTTPNTFLSFGSHINIPEDYNFVLKVKPSHYINNRLYIHSVANLIIASIYDSNNIITMHKHTLEYIFNELLTNAIKYAKESEEIKIIAVKVDNIVYFRLSNIITDDVLNTFTEFLQMVYTEDNQKIFMDRIDYLCNNIHDSVDKSGIGIMTLLNDYNLPLSYEINKCKEDNNTVITTFYWEAEKEDV